MPSVLRVHKTTLMFDDLLERFRELRKAVILIVTVYHTERIQIQLSQGKRCKGQGQGEIRNKLPAVLLPRILEQHLISQQHM